MKCDLWFRLVCFAGVAILVSFEATASVIWTTGDGTATDPPSAMAEFDIVGGNLQVTLTNSSADDVLVPEDVLTGIFFDVAGDPALSPISAVLASGSSVVFPPATDTDGDSLTGGAYAGGDVGAEWSYRNGLSGTPGGQGISSSGMDDVFGPGDRFDTTRNIQGPASPNGLQYGLTSAGDDLTTGNTPVTGGSRGNPAGLIQNSVVMTLGGVPTVFSLSDISNVSFQYGTGLSEPNLPGIPLLPPPPPPLTPVIPEPSTMLLMGLGFAGLAAKTMRNRKTF